MHPNTYLKFCFSLTLSHTYKECSDYWSVPPSSFPLILFVLSCLLPCELSMFPAPSVSFLVLRCTVLTRITRVTAGSTCLSISVGTQYLNHNRPLMCPVLCEVHCWNPELLSSEAMNSISSAVLKSQHLTSHLTIFWALQSLCPTFPSDLSALEVAV